MYELITVELIEYDSEKHEYKAKIDNRDIIVDPYVGCAWESNKVELGIFTFEGHWYKYEYGTFLPNREIINSIKP